MSNTGAPAHVDELILAATPERPLSDPGPAKAVGLPFSRIAMYYVRVRQAI